MKNKNGYALISLLMGILIVGYLYSQTARNAAPVAPAGSPASPIQRSWEVLCQTNKVAIQQALQVHAMQHGPMKTLDLKALSSVIRLPAPPAGCPCSYSFNETGQVTCTVHK
jgi:hypothetical protein